MSKVATDAFVNKGIGLDIKKSWANKPLTNRGRYG